MLFSDQLSSYAETATGLEIKLNDGRVYAYNSSDRSLTLLNPKTEAEPEEVDIEIQSILDEILEED
jgi:hypothetical protein